MNLYSFDYLMVSNFCDELYFKYFFYVFDRILVVVLLKKIIYRLGIVIISFFI